MRQIDLRAPVFGSLLLLVAIPGCTRHEPVGAVGPNDEISVFTNLPREGEIVGLLTDLLVYDVEVAQLEPAFRLDFPPYSRFGTHQYVKSLVFAVDLSRDDDLAGSLPRLMGRVDEGRLEAREPFMHLVHDLWATGQTTLFVVGWSESELRTLLEETDWDGLRRQLENSVVEGLTKTMFGTGEERGIPAQVGRQYGWTLRLNSGFYAADDPQGRFVKFNARDPVRLILVHWEPTEAPLTFEYWQPVLDRILLRYNDGDRIDLDFTQRFPVTFQGAEALKWEGVWQNEKYVIGGPLRAFAFHRGGRSFLLVGQVFAPGQDKLPALRRVEALMNTFRVIR